MFKKFDCSPRKILRFRSRMTRGILVLYVNVPNYWSRFTPFYTNTIAPSLPTCPAPQHRAFRPEPSRVPAPHRREFSNPPPSHPTRTEPPRIFRPAEPKTALLQKAIVSDCAPLYHIFAHLSTIVENLTVFSSKFLQNVPNRATSCHFFQFFSNFS